MFVNSRQPLPEIGRCVWRVLIGNRLGGLESEESKNCNAETNRGHTTLHDRARLALHSKIGRKQMPSNSWMRELIVPPANVHEEHSTLSEG